MHKHLDAPVFYQTVDMLVVAASHVGQTPSDFKLQLGQVGSGHELVDAMTDQTLINECLDWRERFKAKQSAHSDRTKNQSLVVVHVQQISQSFEVRNFKLNLLAIHNPLLCRD
jgi:hypothetical protein